MDPEFNQKEQARLARRVLKLCDAQAPAYQIRDVAQVLAELVVCLDEWRARGGAQEED